MVCTTILRPNHVGITVSSLADALAFWNEALGLEIVTQYTSLSTEPKDEQVETLIGVNGAKIKLAHVAITKDFLVELIEYTSASASAEEGVTFNSKPNVSGAMHLNVQVKGLDGILEKGKKLGWNILEGAGIIDVPGNGESNPPCRVVHLRGPNQEMLELLEVKEVKEVPVVEEMQDVQETQKVEEMQDVQEKEEVQEEQKVQEVEEVKKVQKVEEVEEVQDQKPMDKVDVLVEVDDQVKKGDKTKPIELE
ncbi:hypothetical protein BO94DRAFT_574300 [Aspergillus sclerotioniger CBS 115572]|uniref:Glyoxalase/fosfomycin resistance/dioxygenase domain-containing protein n=1 Tax=Aspergillus sclerotioniger CBS 115572 TaxID=1450535 RepID=A0A317WVZ9_9EURO|nr:hypothetical protein BO94DRAFT_574300 [Aspergillus sclerotioniger CBS 115572]PWY90584.1 hypothetical protein BO94DRAFT_574300 [Aspergillus sclerotioniger CBS 115572]